MVWENRWLTCSVRGLNIKSNIDSFGKQSGFSGIHIEKEQGLGCTWRSASSLSKPDELQDRGKSIAVP